MVEMPNFLRELEKELEKGEELFVDMRWVVRVFYFYLLENVDIWNGKEKADIVESINRFISSSFENVLNKSLDFYVEFIVNKMGITLNDYVEFLYKKLVQRSNIKFSTSGMYQPDWCSPTFSIVSVPWDAENLSEWIRKNTRYRGIVKCSNNKNRISMMNVVLAVPLAAYSELRECYESYDKLYQTSPGLHLYETKKYNWSKLPSPLPQSEWYNGYCIESQVKEEAEWKEIFDKALQYGFIRAEVQDGVTEYCCYWGSFVSAEKILAEFGLAAEDPQEKTVILDCFETVMKIMESEERLSESRKLYNSRMKTLDDDTLVPDEEFAKEIFIKMVTVREHVKEMVQDWEKALEVAELLKKVIKNRSSLSKNITID